MSFLENVIVVKDFVKKYGDYIAVDHISFEVKAGSIFSFLGPNGAGKSTTINTLCTILEKTSGTLLIDGKDVSCECNDVRKMIGVVFQDSTLDNKMTVEENLKMHAHFYNLHKSTMNERINHVLKIVDLLDSKKMLVRSLSGGMKRRIEIARSLLHSPKVLFLDEPTTGLDPQTRTKIWDYLIKLQKEENMTIFLTTHYMDEAEISHKVGVIDHGKIIAFDSPQALKEKYTKDKAHISSMNQPALEALLERYGMTYKKEIDDYVIEVNHLPTFIQLMNEHRNAIKSMEMKKGTLNNAFINMTGKEIRG